MTDTFKLIEKALLQLLQIVATLFTETEISEVQEYIDVGEYGLALDTFIDIIIEENKSVPSSILPLLEELTRLMDLDSDYLARLGDHVTNT